MTVLPFPEISGQESAKLALVLAAINPRCGGVLIVGASGTGKSRLALSLRVLLPPMCPLPRCRFTLPTRHGWEPMTGRDAK